MLPDSWIILGLLRMSWTDLLWNVSSLILCVFLAWLRAVLELRPCWHVLQITSVRGADGKWERLTALNEAILRMESYSCETLGGGSISMESEFRSHEEEELRELGWEKTTWERGDGASEGE